MFTPCRYCIWNVFKKNKTQSELRKSFISTERQQPSKLTTGIPILWGDYLNEWRSRSLLDCARLQAWSTSTHQRHEFRTCPSNCRWRLHLCLHTRWPSDPTLLIYNNVRVKSKKKEFCFFSHRFREYPYKHTNQSVLQRLEYWITGISFKSCPSSVW